MRNSFFKILFLLVVLSLPVVSYAGDNGRGVYAVNGFYSHSSNIARYLKQASTGANESCGPTAMLFIANHFLRKQGIPSDITTNADGAQAIAQVYSDIGISYNSQTNLTQLRNLARYDWGYSTIRTKRMSSSDSTITNVGKLINYLKQDIPAIVVLDSNFSRNPTQGGHNIDHLVVVYAYQRRRDDSGNAPLNSANNHLNDRFYFYDPYYGRSGYFTRGELPYATDLYNFAFLAVGS